MAHTISRRALSVLASLLLLGGLFASCAKQSPLSFDQMRERYYLTLVPDADLSDTLVQRRINALDDAAGPLWKSLNKAPDRGWLWEENKDTTVSMMMGGNFAKLNTLAAAYRTKGSRYYGNPEMKADILAGLDWAIANRYNPSVEWYDNWWDWVIGVPMTLNNTLVLMYDDLSPEQLRAALGAMDHFAPDVTYEGAATGANKIWQCGIMAVRGILGQNPDQLKMAVDGLGTEFKYVTGKDGFYEDGSFVQHQWHPYTGGYGRSMLSQMADLIALLSGTPWAVPQPYEAMLYEWIHNGYEPLVYRGAMMDMTRGREISRPGCTDRWAGHSILVSMLRLSEVAPAAEKERLQAFVKANVLSDDNRDFMQDVPTYLLASARALMADGEVKPEAPQTLNKVFGAMDRAVHKRPGFALGIAMSSNRIENYETINGENLCAWYTGDGMTYLYDNDLAQYSDSFWPTVNPYRMAGTTEDTRVREAKTLPFGPGLLYADGYKSPQHWVGGSSIEGRYGMAGMWYDAQDCTLEAKKSWLMAGDEIVALGAGISSTDGRTIETTVENRKMNPGADYRLTLDGEAVLAADGVLNAPSAHWAHFAGVDEHTNVGYWFPQPAAVNLRREARTGSWYAISQPYNPKEPITRSYFTLWLDHGKSPNDATYAYVLLPGRDAAATAAFAAAPGVEILANTPQVQAARNTKEGVTGFSFWEAAGPVAGVSADAPASVIVHETPETITVGVSDPTHLNTGAVRVTLSEAKAAKVAEEHPEVKVVSLSPVVLEVGMDGSLGRTRSVTLRK